MGKTDELINEFLDRNKGKVAEFTLSTVALHIFRIESQLEVIMHEIAVLRAKQEGKDPELFFEDLNETALKFTIAKFEGLAK